MPVSRLRLKDMMDGELPQALGICQGDWPRLANVVNRAQRRLMTCREAGDTGWWGSYAEIVFNVSRNAPYITLPRGAARLIAVDACDTPIAIANQFYEYLRFGTGRWPKSSCNGSTCDSVIGLGAFRRSVAPTFVDLATSGEFLRAYPQNAADAGMRVLVGCLDVNGIPQKQLDGPMLVNGLFMVLEYPWVNLTFQGVVTPLELSAITAIQKDVTLGSVSFYAVSIATGAERLILTMEPSETVAAYQVYYFDSVPQGCCQAAGATDDSLVQMTAMVKLDLVPAQVDSDYLLIQSEDAILAEAQSARFSDMDAPQAKTQAAERHQAAVRYLQGQLVHYEGKEQPAVSFAPFGSARLACQLIGKLM